MTEQILTQEYLHTIFGYKDGELFWKVRTSNCVQIGDKVGCFDSSNGYYKLRLNNKYYHNHRLIFLMHHGYLPKMVDHIDCNRGNNKIENLRKADQYTNQQNQKISKNSSSGHKNVVWSKTKNKWAVRLMIDGKTKHKGYFKDLQEAANHAKRVREEAFGEFANHG
jgi:hypothetical protein